MSDRRQFPPITDVVVYMLAVLLLALLFSSANGAEPKPVRNPADAVVRVGGCSGVCVHPSGIVFTAKHCEPGEAESITFPKHPAARGRRIYVGPDAEDVVAFDLPGDDWPYLEVSAAPPARNSDVWSGGYPAQRDGSRPFRESWGKVTHSSTATLLYNGRPLGDFRANDATIVTGPGWSGGPLLTRSREVVGLLTSGGPMGSTYLSHAAVLRAYKARLVVQARGGVQEPRQLDLEQPILGDAEEFDPVVLEEPKPVVRKPYVLYFSLSNCPPCRQFKADWNAGRVANSSKYRLVEINVETKKGAETYRAVVAAIRKRRGIIDSYGNFPAFHVRGEPRLRVGWSSTRRTAIGSALKAVYDVARGAWQLPATVLELAIPPLRDDPGGTDPVSFDVDAVAEADSAESFDVGPELPVPLDTHPETKPAKPEPVVTIDEPADDPAPLWQKIAVAIAVGVPSLLNGAWLEAARKIRESVA